MKKFLILTGLILLTFVTPVTAATYYVSANGHDSDPGTQGSPWKNCPGMKTWTGSKTLVVGDTVYFKNTDMWTGTAGRYDTFFELQGGVTYDGMTWGTAGSRATISVTSDDINSASVTFYTDDPVLPTVFNGFLLLPVGSATAISFDWPLGSKMTNQTGAVKRVQNCIIDGAGQDIDDTYGIVLAPYGGHTVRNVEIRDNVVKNCLRDGIYLYPGNEVLPDVVSDVIVQDNECYRNGRSHTSSGAGIKLKNHVIRALIDHNYVHDNYGAGITFDADKVVHSGPEDCTIRFNLVMNGIDAGRRKWNSAFPIASGNSMSASAQIYGNIMWNPAFTKGIYITSSSSDNNIYLKIYNNIIYSDGPAVYTESNTAAVDLSNNILIAQSGAAVLYDTYNVVDDHRSNIYWRMNGSNLVSVNDGRTRYNAANLVKWEPDGFSSNPNFKDAGNLPTGFSPDGSPDTDGLSVLSGNAIGHGTDLGSPYDYAINNVLRGTNWDIGPYETTATSAGPFITVTAPNDGQNWQRGSVHTITWEYTDSPGSAVNIKLLKAGVVSLVITADTEIGMSGAGSYTWEIPDTHAPGADYRIQITSTSDSTYTDTSDGNFTISTRTPLPGLNAFILLGVLIIGLLGAVLLIQRIRKR